MTIGELAYIQDAFDKNWITTAGENVTGLEELVTAYLSGEKAPPNSGGRKLWYGVGLSSGTAAIHLALKLAGLRTNPEASFHKGMLRGQKVFVSSLTFNATVNPILYESGEPVFIDSEYETWNMDPAALEQAFARYPEVKIVAVANLYGTPAQLETIRKICDTHHAVLIEDAAESFGAALGNRQTGTSMKKWAITTESATSWQVWQEARCIIWTSISAGKRKYMSAIRRGFRDCRYI